MAGTSSKPLPSSLTSWLNSPSETHRDAGTSTARPTSSFRSSGPALRGTDDDWGRFAATHERPTPTLDQLAGSLETGAAGRFSNEGLYDDGAQLMSLMFGGGSGGATVAEMVDGDWEQELLQEQGGWKRELEVAVPVDPLAYADESNKGKGRGEMVGDEELLSSLSSLSLRDKSYLQSIVAQPENQSISNYLSQNRYTEDIYALPVAVQRVLDQAAQGTINGDEGKDKAVRRLAMVMKHLWGDESKRKGELSFSEAETLVDSALPPRSPAVLLANSTFSPQFCLSPALRYTHLVEPVPAPLSAVESSLQKSRPPSWENYPLVGQHRSSSKPLELGEFPQGHVQGRTDGSGARDVESSSSGTSYETYLRERGNGEGSSI